MSLNEEDLGNENQTTLTGTSRKGGEDADLVSSLLPCPWCSVVPSVFDHSIPGFKDEWSVYCEGEMCAVAPSTSGEFKQHAVSQWNNQAVARGAFASVLAEAIAAAARKAGIYKGDVPLTGPQLVMLCDDLATVAISRNEGFERCLACEDPVLPGEFHPCERPENCTDGDCSVGSTIVGWPHPITMQGCSLASKHDTDTASGHS